MIETPEGPGYFGSLSRELSRVLHPLECNRGKLPIRGYRPPGQNIGYKPPRTAGVLLPILCHPGGPTMLFTVRSMALGNHPGQVSFPGGGIEKLDQDEVAASVRETHEEVGILPSNISPLGVLDYFDTISGYRVLPVVALVETPVALVLDHNEVAASFEVPLDEILERACYRMQLIEHDGQQHEVYSRQWQQHNIWGVTAAILIDLITKLKKQAG